MGVFRFEDLRVWQAAREQCDRVGELIKRPDFRHDSELAGQMNAASISVMFNISEGFLRRRDKETMQFLRYSSASNGELKSGYYAADGRKYLSSTETTELIALNETIARMLRRWQSTLDVPEPRTHRKPRPHRNPGQTDDPDEASTRVGPRTKDQGRTKDRERTKDRGRTKD